MSKREVVGAGNMGEMEPRGTFSGEFNLERELWYRCGPSWMRAWPPPRGGEDSGPEPPGTVGESRRLARRPEGILARMTRLGHPIVGIVRHPTMFTLTLPDPPLRETGA